jgi:hypothetical protein
LARPLQVLNKVAWDMLEALSSENADDATVTAYLRRRKRIFIEEQFDLRRRLVNLRNERCANVRALAEPIVTAIEQRLAVDAVNDAYSHADGEFARLQDCTADEMLEIIRKSLDAINERLLELDASPLGSSFRDSLERISLASATMQFGKSGSPFTDKALRHGTDLLSKSGRDLAKNAGKYAQQATETLKGLFNIKFKPYGKIKLTGSLEKLIGGIGKAVPWIMIGVDLYLNYRDEKDREKAERERQEFRAQVRGAFRDAATSFGDALDASSSTVVAELVDTPLAEVAAEEHALLTANETTSSLKRQLVELQEELTQHLEGIRAS